MSEENKSTYFSFRGLLAALLSAFLSYQIFQVILIIKEAAKSYNENLFFRFFMDAIRQSSTKRAAFVDAGYEKIKVMVLVFFISFVLKTILSLKHAFIEYSSSNRNVFYLFLAEAALFGLFFGFDPFSDFFGNAVKIGIPSFIIYALLDE